MKRRLLAILLVLVLLSSCATVPETPVDVQQEEPQTESQEQLQEQPPSGEPLTVPVNDGNKISNGDFAYGDSAWGLYLEGGIADFKANARQEGVLNIKRVGGVVWGVQLTNDGLALTGGNVYRLSFDAKSTVPRSATIRIQKNASPYTGYIEEHMDLGTEMQSYSYDFEMLERSDPACRLVFNFGVQFLDGLKPDPEEHEITVDNFRLELVEGSEEIFEYDGNKNLPLIHVDQLGYRTDDVKKAILVTDSDTFEICDAATDKIVFSGTASEKMKSQSADENIRVADFTSFTDSGTYYIRNGEGKSYSFQIDGDPYQDVRRAVLDMMEYQKCGEALDAGIWSYDACHDTPAIVFGTDIVVEDVSGGWHDAGDYGRYVSPAAKTVADFLMAYKLGESVDPDLLEIVKYELDWMLKMQDPATGGVYHKLTAEKFCGTIMPDEETDQLYLSPISATATGGFAASLAMASGIYKAVDKEYSAKLLNAAQKAWDWLEANPQYPYFKNPEGITTGEYGDTASNDERLWAACELYGTTGDAKYNDYITGSVMYAGMGWASMGYYASVAYLLLPEETVDTAQRDKMMNSVLGACERIMEAYAKDPYMMSLEKSYPWGSNMTVANNAALLLIGNRLKANPAYVEAAMEHIHYLLGRNALSQSYITGFGTRSPQNPHHRPSEVTGKAVPGMVVGGPDGNLEDPFVATMLKGLAPAKCYADNEQSFSTNEVTVYWNSSVYLVMTMLGM